MDRIDVQPVLPIKLSVIIDTMLNDSDFDEHADGDVTCKPAFIIEPIEETTNPL